METNREEEKKELSIDRNTNKHIFTSFIHSSSSFKNTSLFVKLPVYPVVVTKFGRVFLGEVSPLGLATLARNLRRSGVCVWEHHYMHEIVILC